GRRQLVRKNTVNAGDHLDDLAELHRRESAGELRDAKERGRRALDIVMTLPAEYREPLLLNLRGLSHKQIAIVCELPMSTIETRVFRARVMVRNELEASEGRARKDGSEDKQSRKRLKVSSE